MKTCAYTIVFLGVYNSASSENDFSRTIRQRLCDVASDAEVQDAVNKTGAQYLLILDQGDLDTEDHRRHNVTYNSDQWVGIEAITDDTPGFEPVLSEGDMRLYRITAEISSAAHYETELTVEECFQLSCYRAGSLWKMGRYPA